jgi:hypothetical protein
MKSAVFPFFLPLRFLVMESGGGYSDFGGEVDSTGTGIDKGIGLGRKPMMSTGNGNGNARRPLSYFTLLLPSDGGDSLPVCSSVFEYSLLRSPALSGLRNDFVVQCRVLESG